MSDRSDYRRLQKHLNRQPVGFPATLTGSDIRLLKHLFTPEEARVALGLSHRYRTPEDIASRLGDKALPPDKLEATLSKMAARGSIAVRDNAGVSSYATLPLVVGMYETQVERLTGEFLQDFSSYSSSLSYGLEFISAEHPQMRTIPIEEAVTLEARRTGYDDIQSIIEEAPDLIVVIECICRKTAALKGEPCTLVSRTETCLALGDIAAMCRHMGIGRIVTKDEALDILRRNEADGLVIQPSNTQRVEYICACCGCCCGMLRVQKSLGRPLDFWASGYGALVDYLECTGCGQCIDSCQVDALSLDPKGSQVLVDQLRCIGCGQCVPACPSKALTVQRNDQEQEPPPAMDDLFDGILSRKRNLPEKLLLGLKIIFKVPRKKLTTNIEEEKL